MPTARAHWVEYLIEAAGVAIFIVAAGAAAVMLESPASPVHQALPDPRTRLFLMGLLMGTTVVLLIYSPLGARSGAHFNPAVTLTFYRLGKVTRRDAIAYVVAQFLGGIAGTAAASVLLGAAFLDPPVRAVATVPGILGAGPAFVAEAVMTFGLMLVVLFASNDRRLSPYTGLFAASLVAFYITVEAPVSGMSLNPARSLGPAVAASSLDSYWIYLVAPLAGMLAAGQVFVARRGLQSVFCAKLFHGTAARCPFHCRHHELYP